MDMYKKPLVKPTQAVLNGTPTHTPENGGSNVSVAPLITMIAVLAIILIFCFCGAPAVREFCRKKVCYCCPEPEDEAGTPIERAGSSTPTIILLPFGRMLVVDRSVFAHFQADETGLDFMELSSNLIRAHRLQYGCFGPSTPSILDSEATSKGLSPVSLGYSPPAYEDIVKCDLPPSYSELSLLFRQQLLHHQQQQAHSQQVQNQTTPTRQRRHLNRCNNPQQRRRAVDNCCVQVTASLNDVADVDVGNCADFNSFRRNNEHITTSVLHIVDERHRAPPRTHQRTESDTNIHKKYRILSKQSSF